MKVYLSESAEPLTFPMSPSTPAKDKEGHEVMPLAQVAQEDIGTLSQHTNVSL